MIRSHSTGPRITSTNTSSMEVYMDYKNLTDKQYEDTHGVSKWDVINSFLYMTSPHYITNTLNRSSLSKDAASESFNYLVKVLNIHPILASGAIQLRTKEVPDKQYQVHDLSVFPEYKVDKSKPSGHVAKGFNSVLRNDSIFNKMDKLIKDITM